MNCPEAREAFSDLYDGALSGPPLTDLSRHLDGCPACRAEWAAFRRAMQALQDLGGEEPPHGFAARVAERLEAPGWWQRLGAMLVLPLRVKLPIHAAALVLLGLAGLWVSQRSSELERAAMREAPASGVRAVQDAPPPTPVAPRKTVIPPPAAGKVESRAGASEATDAAQERPAREEAPRPVGAPALPPAERKASPSGRLQSAPTPPEARAKAEATAQPESEASVLRPGMSGPARQTAEELFSSAVSEFAAERYEAAIADLRAFLAQHPDDGRAPDARLLLGDAYRGQGRHAEAGAEFETFLRQYPRHPRAPLALYRQGEARILLGDPSGCGILRNAVSRYPAVREATAAREMLSARCP